MKAIFKMIVLTGGLLIASQGRPAMASTITYSPSLELPASLLSMKVSEFVKLSAHDYSWITAKKLSMKDRIAFSVMKRGMKKSLKSGSDQTVKDYLATADKKDKTGLIIVLVILVVVVTAVIIATVQNSINLGLGGLGG